MQITLYKTSSEHNALTKLLTSPSNITGALKSNCDMLNPVIILKYEGNINKFNYCYIPEFGRYYYIEDMTYINNTIELRLHVDVLMSHATNIKNSRATITRGNKGSVYLNDGRIQNTAQHTLTYRQIGGGFTKADYYTISIAGGNVQ